GHAMHELGLTEEIIAIVSERFRGARVKRVVLEIGKLSAVRPMRSGFASKCVPRTRSRRVRPWRSSRHPAWAVRGCGAETILEQPFGRCACGNTDLEWLAGDELRIKEVELA